ncbi:MAG: DUF2971 domain-containing protein [Verrucomicrobiota bacterium]|jgi:hypothetical protein
MADSIPIYRYLDSDAALKTLAAGRFRVALVSTLNDPFEWNLGFRGAAAPHEHELAKNFREGHLRWLETQMGILSFSKTMSDPALWSFYANKHSGVAFEVKYPWGDKHIVDMRYSPERPVLDWNRLRGIRDKGEWDKYLLSLVDGMMRQKSPSWSFEQERRLQIDINDRVHCQLSDGRHYWQIPREGLKQVILGYCCPLQEADVRKLLDMNGYAATVVVRAKLCPETYSVII